MAWQMSHNAVLARIRTVVAFKCTILSENQDVGPNCLRQDLVARIDNNIYIIDRSVREYHIGLQTGPREKGVQKPQLTAPFFYSRFLTGVYRANCGWLSGRLGPGTRRLP
ncbi:hypothetical protein TNIN_72681 [Trichonephila inaurata madagascariensis]|uniref:Uncharacterized protein n=1 Tax=Trichonephila inaurata madagascariensis TaxID=2747483 RepID=A0A8X6WYK1_9ARAC|nr:hypothetical protein TNIN_72681 [Trichonephila inaurata madagascariensis]